jgi:hypothetical protein
MENNVIESEPIGSPGRPVSGPVVLGALMVVTGGALLLDRLGLLPASWRLTVWPILLAAYGVARLAQPRASGRQGLFFVIVGAWWLAGTGGWVSLARTWPIVVVALGLSLMVQAATASRSSVLDRDVFRSRHAGAGWLVPLIVLGALLTSSVDRGSFALGDTSHGQFRTYAMMSRRVTTPPATALSGGDMVVLMGSSLLDLRQMTIPSGTTATVNVLAMMGEGRIAVPANWAVDVEATPILGNVSSFSDHRDDWSASAAEPAPADGGPAPHLVIRGVIMMGRLRVQS